MTVEYLCVEPICGKWGCGDDGGAGGGRAGPSCLLCWHQQQPPRLKDPTRPLRPSPTPSTTPPADSSEHDRTPTTEIPPIPQNAKSRVCTGTLNVVKRDGSHLPVD